MSDTQEPFEVSTADAVVETKTSTAKAIAVQGGKIQPTTHHELNYILQEIADGGGMPKRFETAAQQLAAYNLARALMGDRWQMAVNHIAPIHGQMMIYGELPRTLAEVTGQVKEFKVYAIDKEYKEICLANKNLHEDVYAGVCEVQRQGRMMKQYSYTLEEARKAGQYPPMKPEWVNKQRTGKMLPNDDSPWSKYTKIMLMRKAQAIGVKFEFPDALAGAPIAEYDADELPDYVPVKDVTPRDDKAKLINEKFKGVQ